MKNVIMTICLLAAITTAHTQTTLEEYNYLTKGYKIQIESGLDMKKGYSFKDLTISEAKNAFSRVSMIFKGLYRDGEQTPCAVLVIVDKNYICIPHFESSLDLWQQYFQSTIQLNDFYRLALLKGLARSTAFFAQNN